VVANFPFGKPVNLVVGFGGAFGAQLLQEKTFLTSTKNMVKQVMDDLLHRYLQQSASEMCMLGLKVGDDGEGVVVAINKRPLCVDLSEHFCCDNFVVVERGTGGTKGLSKTPKLAYLPIVMVFPATTLRWKPLCLPCLSTKREIIILQRSSCSEQSISIN
jgi:hypothetical protein